MKKNTNTILVADGRLSPAAVLQMIESQQLSGVLHAESGSGHKVRLQVTAGAISFAITSLPSGGSVRERAFNCCALLVGAPATWDYRFDVEERPARLAAGAAMGPLPITAALLEAARRVDERRGR